MARAVVPMDAYRGFGYQIRWFMQKAFCALGTGAERCVWNECGLCREVAPAVLFPMGGVVINETREVSAPHFEPILGVRGSWRDLRGTRGNRSCGSSLLECCVFGRIALIAADEAAKNAQ